MVDIELQGLKKVFDTPSGPEVAVDEIDLEIDHGEFFTFVGPSGCGKTTTLRMIAGLEEPTSGRILFDGSDVTDLPPQQRDIAFVFQTVALYPHMTNFDNIAYGLRVSGETDYDDKIHDAAELLEITDLLDKQPGQLSGGQRQRVALGRAIVRDPNVILLDEPMSDLDAKLKASLRVEIQRVHQEVDTTMVYVTHDQEEAMTMSDTIGLMNNGRLAQVDEPEQIFHSPNSHFVSDFIGQPSMNFIDARITRDGMLHLYDDSPRIDLGQYGTELRETLDSQGEVRFGFRPRQIKLTEHDAESFANFEIDVWEPIGTDYVLHLVDENLREIQVVTDQVTDLTRGESIGIKEFTVMYFFDPKSGEKILQLDASDLKSIPPQV